MNHPIKSAAVNYSLSEILESMNIIGFRVETKIQRRTIWEIESTVLNPESIPVFRLVTASDIWTNTQQTHLGVFSDVLPNFFDDGMQSVQLNDERSLPAVYLRCAEIGHKLTAATEINKTVHCPHCKFKFKTAWNV